MEIKRKSNFIIQSIICIFLGLFVTACDDGPTGSPFVDETKENTILIYAIATNNLSNNLIYDKNEIRTIASQLNLKKNNILIFETTYSAPPRIIKLTESDLIENPYDFEVIKEYSKDKSGLDPERISEVLNDVISEFEADSYGLIFWSHSTASQPWLPALQTQRNSASESLEAVELPMVGSFGQDKNSPTQEFEQINIDKLASLIPDNLFSFIWFDSCYMSNIETIYEFRDKCRYYIGYPTEVLEYGMPYDLVLPFLLGKEANIKEASEAFFKYYAEYPSSNLRIATIAAIDMNELEDFADFCKEKFVNKLSISYRDLYRYTNVFGSNGPFFDLGDYIKAMAANAEIEMTDEEWDTALNKLLIYKGATPKDFNGYNVPLERFSGISAHVYDFESSSQSEEYYKSLSWFKRVFE